ncbi:MAG TPA: DUF2283 domain-containing protein [Kineosporiaceae bacterium]|nr:DUF2283 domain-containing protein [Kineosporiaceae bacterium]
MRISYDPTADAAYIYIVESVGAAGVDFTYGCDPAAVGGMIHLDFDSDGRLVGLEILGASSKLPVAILREAERERESGGQ